MRIVYLSASHGPHDRRFLAALSKSQHEAIFLRLGKHVAAGEDLRLPPRIRQIAWRGDRGDFRWRDVPRLALDLRRVVSTVRPDLIHAGPIQTCAFTAVLSGFRPVLTMSWGFDLMQDAERNPWWRWVTRYTLQRSSFFVSDARVTRSRAISYGMRAARTAVFPWGVDLGRFRPRVGDRGRDGTRRSNARRSRPQQPETKRPFIVYCNRSWEPRYGVDVLATAFGIAARKEPRLSLSLMGDGSQAATIRGLLADDVLRRRVRYVARVGQSALPGWYRRADLFVSPSHVDGSSVSLLEAMACGTAVLVSDIPANREWVREDVNGFLFPDGDADTLADRLIEISARRSALPRIRRAARKVAEERADWEKNFGVLLRAYARTVRNRDG
jgi:glycosyltransferase involved in cell wall biosynthesis